MADYPTLDQYEYNQKCRLYNDAGRENVGLNYVTMADWEQVYDTQGSTLQTFHIDVTRDSLEPVKVCSFKNGASIRMTWHDYTPGPPPHGNYGAWVDLQYYDKNGNPGSGDHQAWYIEWRPEGQSPESTTINYYPPSFEYGLVTQEEPIGAWTGGCIIAYDKVPALVINKPDFTNTVINRDKFAQWYTFYGYNVKPFNDLMEDLGPGSTPKKPEDDTSKPDPNPDPDYDDDPDPIPDPELPTKGDAISTGFIRVYTPSTAQLRSLANQLWDDDPTAFVNVISKIQNDPMEAVISLHTVPYQLVGTNANCMIGNYDTHITMPAIDKQWYTINLGSLYLPEKWGSALDYDPYNTIDIFLPYIGIRSMQVDDVVGKLITVKYMTDVLTGATVAHITCGSSILYTYNTMISNEIPLAQSSYGPLYRTMANSLTSMAMNAATGGVTGAIGGVSAAINVALSKHSNVTRSGSITSCYGCMSHFYPYLIIHRPIQSLASGFKHFKGYPSNITTSLGSISGYTEIESIHLDGIACTEAERDEIRALLYNGVIF